MNNVEKMAAISYSGESSTDRAAYQITLVLIQLADDMGGLDVMRAKLESVIATGAATKQFKKWAKGREDLS